MSLPAAYEPARSPTRHSADHSADHLVCVAGLPTVALLSPHEIVLTALRTMLADADAPVRLVEADLECEPDVLLYDVVRLADGDTTELDEWVYRTASTVVALTGALRPDLGPLALERGAAATLDLTDSGADIVAAIMAATRLEAGEATATGHANGHANGHPKSDGTAPMNGNGDHPAPGGLSPREVDVVRLVVLGLSNQAIAEQLFLSINSVKTYIRSAYRKIGALSRSQAVTWGMLHGFAPRNSDPDPD